MRLETYKNSYQEVHKDIIVNMEDEKEMCMNCKRDISCANYQMHTAHCARHITLCKKCDEPIPKKDAENHKCGEEMAETPSQQKQVPCTALPKTLVDKKEVIFLFTYFPYFMSLRFNKLSH